MSRALNGGLDLVTDELPEGALEEIYAFGEEQTTNKRVVHAHPGGKDTLVQTRQCSSPGSLGSLTTFPREMRMEAQDSYRASMQLPS